jgi:hypothetical protein
MDAQVLWNPASGSDVYRSVVPLQRYRFITQRLRFDDKSMRNKEDPFVHIRGLWSRFVENCIAYYSPSIHCTIDEKLLGFRGRCPFRVYIPKRPDKYEIKIVMICDSHTYFISGMPYLGKETPNGDIPLADYFVMELSKSIQGSNRNITVGNWFSSLPLLKTVLDKKLTMVGILRKNKRKIPREIIETKGRKINTCVFLFSSHDNIQFTSCSVLTTTYSLLLVFLSVVK